MKKLSLLFIGMAIITASLQAQFKMTAKTHGFRVGDAHNFVFAKGTDEGQSGRNVIWDFTSLQKVNRNLTSHMLDPKSSEGSIDNSNLVLEEFGNKFYFDANNDGMLQYGAISCNTVTKYDKPFVKLKFPFSYGNKVSGYYSGTQSGGATAINITGSYEIFADAYGTLLLPDDVTFENVLRVKQTRVISYENSSSSLTEITYRWYDKDVRYPVLVMVKYVSDNSSNIAETAIYSEAVNQKKSAQISTSVQNIEGLTALNMYPNPYDDVLNITYNLNQDSKVSIELYDVSGKLFRSVLKSNQNKGIQTVVLSSSELNMMPGVYYLKVHTGDQTFTRKVVKQ